jgi:hypothetical protein
MTAGRPRNPFRSEADAFRLLLICVAAAAVVIAVALLVSSLAGALLGAVFVVIGLWRAFRVLQEWRQHGSS